MPKSPYASPSERRRRARNTLSFYLFISPWLAGFFLLTVGPLLFSLYASFTRWTGISPPRLTGLANFREMFAIDDRFWKSLVNTFYFAGASVCLTLSVSLALARLVNRRLPGAYAFRAVFYLPSVVAGVALYMVWAWLYDANLGILNYLLALIGLRGPNWLLDPRWAMPSLVLMSATFCGGPMLIFLAGLQDVPQEYYEAARIDGASALRIFFVITLPLLTPVLFYNFVVGVIVAMQIFTEPFIMTVGGPMLATYTYGLHLYNTAFRYFNFGYASALAWVLFVIILALSLGIVASAGSWVHYEGGGGGGPRRKKA
jgi:multiple sugar transport system permease protein